MSPKVKMLIGVIPLLILMAVLSAFEWAERAAKRISDKVAEAAEGLIHWAQKEGA